MHTLKIQNLTVEIEGKIILRDFNLEINSGEIHVIMGPNGTGKSTLSRVIMGDNNYNIISGKISYDDNDLSELKTSDRALLGLFLGMQMPLELEGVTNADLLRTAVHNKEKENFKLFPFIKEVEQKVECLKMNKDMIHRDVNVGFSGGERKKNEILQMYLLKPSMIMLDEIDSGLDVDSLKIVGENVMNYFNSNDCGLLIVTHYQRLLDYIHPNYVHIMKDGTIIYSGNAELVKQIEENGYEQFENVNNYSTSDVKEKLNAE